MEKGISLVALVITIIVLIILTAAVILTATNSNIFGKSEEAVFKSDVTAFQEELTKSILEEQLKDNTFDPSTINASTSADLAKWIPSIAGTKYEGLFEIDGGKLIYTGEDTKQIEYIQAIGISTNSAGGNNPSSDTNALIQFPITIQVGDNAYATWTNDVGGGTITVSGTGATWDFKNGETYLSKFAEELEKQGVQAPLYGVMMYASSASGIRMSFNDIANASDEDFASIGITDKELFVAQLEELNLIEHIVYEEGITSIGEGQIINTTIMTDITFPSTLTSISSGAFKESTFDEPIIIPSSVTTIGYHIFIENKVNTLYMKAANGNNITFVDTTLADFEDNYNVEWGK